MNVNLCAFLTKVADMHEAINAYHIILVCMSPIPIFIQMRRSMWKVKIQINTLRTGDADLRF